MRLDPFEDFEAEVVSDEEVSWFQALTRAPV